MPKPGERWAKTVRRRPSRVCETCLWAASAGPQGKACLEFVAGVAEVRKAGKSDVSVRILVEKVGQPWKGPKALEADEAAGCAYPYTGSALGNHVRLCLGYAWPRVFLARG